MCRKQRSTERLPPLELLVHPDLDGVRLQEPMRHLALVGVGHVAVDDGGQQVALVGDGDAFAIEPGKIHDGKNVGTTPSKALVVFVAEKGKPLRTDVQ